MVQLSNVQARIPHLYDMMRELREKLGSPNILVGRVLYDTLVEHQDEFAEQAFPAIVHALEVGSRQRDTATLAVRAICTQIDEASPDSDEWKQSALETIIPRLDRFLATRPAGGKRRKTRKGKSRRARYSRRR